MDEQDDCKDEALPVTLSQIINVEGTKKRNRGKTYHCLHGRRKVQEEQKRDDSLKDERQWADKQEKGFCWKDGLLCHMDRMAPDKVRTRIVVPMQRNQRYSSWHIQR